MWPPPPADMSVSTYAEIEECPRRWALSAAEYPELWGGRGYPPKLQVAALAGSVVHLALEIILKQLTRASVPSLHDPSAPQVLRELGGYTRVVEECVERILKRYVDNPRAGALIKHAQRSLRGQVPTLRARVQSMLSRLRLPKSAPSARVASAPKPGAPPSRLPLVNGIHPEVEIRAKSIGWKGKVDLLVLGDDACEITDFKTGAADEAHKFQVRAYAVMWRLDGELNPSGRPVDRLVLAYESQDVDVESLGESEINDLARELIARRREAEAALATRPPSAHPNTETCRYCDVRQLCDTYWVSDSLLAVGDGQFGDIELLITGIHGPKSWDAEVVRARRIAAKTPVLLRLHQPTQLNVGSHVRVLYCALAIDADDLDGTVVVTTVGTSEVYVA